MSVRDSMVRDVNDRLVRESTLCGVQFWVDGEPHWCGRVKGHTAGDAHECRDGAVSEPSIVCMAGPGCSRPHAGGMGGVPVHPPVGARISGDEPLIDDPDGPADGSSTVKVALVDFSRAADRQVRIQHELMAFLPALVTQAQNIEMRLNLTPVFILPKSLEISEASTLYGYRVVAADVDRPYVALPPLP